MAAPPTPSQTVGPFFAFGLLDREHSQLVAPESSGAIRISGRILDGAGEPVPDAMVELWQADSDGRYAPGFGWGRSGCDSDGRFAFVTLRPGRVGGSQAPHLSVLVFARGLLKPVRTRMYFPDEPANADDPVLAALPEAERARLVAGVADGGLEFDVRLQGPDQTPFFAV